MSNDDDLVHIGKRSWWDGTAKTLCGERWSAADRVVFPRVFGRKVCPACEAAQKNK
ncbi:hypothetical protein [Saccharothrix sp. NRRL B-16314]|uniref:hypothetical protein n=1 Tax=Saccharothrix sp. NRRL B-16314 TaxID=1463825 RepID=UPI000B205466|nr:hypothetical protein [Saccharothrix sp. NRRL B-16314]